MTGVESNGDGGDGRDPTVDVAGVDASFGDLDVLDGVSLSVDPGEFVGLVGPNGAGKTTLLRTINGAVAPDAGRVSVCGRPIDALSSREASRLVATVPQDTGVRFAFTVEDLVAMGRTPHRSRFGGDPDAADHVERALRRAEVEGLRDRRVDELSGGERQRVYLARALAQDAPALVLDEPTSSLDVNHAARTLSLVRDLVGEDRAAVAAIHDLEAAARYCDRLALLHDGGVVARGPPEAVLTSATLETAFDARAAVTENPLTGSLGVTTLPAPAGESVRVHVIGGGRVGARVLGCLWAAGHAVSAGPLPAGDAALGVARSLDVPVDVAPAFVPLSEATLTDARERVRAADVAVLADPDLAPSLDLVGLAREGDRLVLVAERPLEERNHAGAEGRRAAERLRDESVVAAVDDVDDAVRRVTRSRRVAADD
ncbi:ATP-binding cassette domain-containing protein [Halomicrobium salinisoli]|uniref:ATP-binding cassette domain-containing protein n=1 Tax=Halomicrobium salinisoli TaxID=2878391 RepID=UPI001CF04908|nr:ATP-binding cassette domain-containing protein [Halomicrobium salinisoli]